MGKVTEETLYTSYHPQPGDHFKNIAIREEIWFAVRVSKGSIEEIEPEFRLNLDDDVKERVHRTLEEAQADFEKELHEGIAAGLKPYTESLPELIRRLNRLNR